MKIDNTEWLMFMMAMKMWMDTVEEFWKQLDLTRKEEQVRHDLDRRFNEIHRRISLQQVMNSDLFEQVSSQEMRSFELQLLTERVARNEKLLRNPQDKSHQIERGLER